MDFEKETNEEEQKEDLTKHAEDEIRRSHSFYEQKNYSQNNRNKLEYQPEKVMYPSMQDVITILQQEHERVAIYMQENNLLKVSDKYDWLIN